MERSDKEQDSPKRHITAIFDDYVASARVLQTLTNLSNTVIETALSGQCKFLFEILQNADDAFDDQSKYKDIGLNLILLDDYFIIQHNGKVFNYYDVERICDYASQIEEVKANDLSKTGYKGLGFKSLFNLSDCIYIYSNGYSFRFDKYYWPDPEKKPWQVIPIWCDTLPLSEIYTYDQPVNFVMKINDKKELKIQLNELINRPEVLLYLHRVNSINLNLDGVKHILNRKIEEFGIFHKVIFLKDHRAVSVWLSKTYERVIPTQLRRCVQEVSKFIYPDKIKNAKEIDLTFTLCITETVEEVSKINGFCYSTLPTQLQLSLPYHVNSIFILNLDRTQFHENEWNEFLIYQIGYLQLNLLKNLAETPYLKNYVIELLVRKINHPYSIFNKAFSRGFDEAKKQFAWLPTYKGYLLKLGEVCVDEIHFFKQNFQNIQDKLCDHIIDYGVKGQCHLLTSEAVFFNYNSLLDQFPNKYYPQLTENSYKRFLNYLYEISSTISYKLQNTSFLRTKNGSLVSPQNALLEEEENSIPDFALLNPVDNRILPVNKYSFKCWLIKLGAKSLNTPIRILRESVFQWIESNTLQYKMNKNNHVAIICYLAKSFMQFSTEETNMLKKKLLILTKSNEFKTATSCYLPNAINLEELGKMISSDKIIAPCYNISSLKNFFTHLEISNSLSSIEIFRKCIFVWIKNKEMKTKFTMENYKPIIEYLSTEYQWVEYFLSESEKELLQTMPVLTCNQTFQEAKLCYFDTVVPNVQGFENAIAKHKLVYTQYLNEYFRKFLEKIGVQKYIHPVDILRNSVLKWIQEETVQSKINSSNHRDIVKYIAEHWNNSCYLTEHEKKNLQKLPVLTEGNVFRKVCACFWQNKNINESDDKIPKLEFIISANELISSEYCAYDKETMSKVKILLNDLGICHLKFSDICYRYCDYLTDRDCINWFFSNFIEYWEKNKKFYRQADKDKLLINLKAKLHSSNVLAKNGKKYLPTELYSSRFLDIYNTIDRKTIPILAYENLPIDLEKWMGIKQELELPCIIKLLQSIEKRQNLGEEITLNFFRTILEQLRLKNKKEIKKYPLKLLSKDNKLTLAKQLNYFKEEDSVCFADSCYLKRIHGMSHAETMELAQLCDVNIFQFQQEVNYGEKEPSYDESLKEFYLERLPLIVLQESKVLNESPFVVLKKLFLEVNSIELYECQNIVIKYPFGKPVEQRCYFDHFRINVVKGWKNFKTRIHEHIKHKIKFISDITEIADMESVTECKADWLRCQKEDPEKLKVIEEALSKLLSGKEINYMETNKYNFVDTVNNTELSPKQNIDTRKGKVTSMNLSTTSRNKNLADNNVIQQAADFIQLKSTPSDTLVCKEDLNTEFENVNPAANQIDNSKDNNQNNKELHSKVTVMSSIFNYIDLSNSEFQSQQAENVNLAENQSYSSNSQDNIPLKNNNFELDKPFYDNTLKEFYLQRLPTIVQWESKKQNNSPEKILKRLYNKICTIELYQCSDIHIQYPYSYAAETCCFFDDLKIYTVGKWSDNVNKYKIHRYIKEKLCLHTDVQDMSPITTQNEQINPKTNDCQVADEIKTLVSVEEKIQFTSDKEYLKSAELPENEVSIEISSDRNANDNFDYIPSSTRPYYSINFKGSRVLITFQEITGIVEQENQTSDNLDEDTFKVNLSLTPRKPQTYYRKRSQRSFMSKRYSLPINLHIEHNRSLENVANDESHLKKLGEKYVFVFLQDYYKKKYPEAQFTLKQGCFTMKWESRVIEIIWLNESENKELEYDLALKKNDEMKQFIDVKLVNEVNNDSFNLVNDIFNKDQSSAEHPYSNGKYCVYCVLYRNSAVLPTEEEIDINALYKIEQLHSI